MTTSTNEAWNLAQTLLTTIQTMLGSLPSYETGSSSHTSLVRKLEEARKEAKLAAKTFEQLSDPNAEHEAGVVIHEIENRIQIAKTGHKLYRLSLDVKLFADTAHGFTANDLSKLSVELKNRADGL